MSEIDHPGLDMIRAGSFGFRSDPFSGKPTFHSGIDYRGNIGTDIPAAASGPNWLRC